MTTTETTNSSDKNRYKMTVLGFVFFSIAGGGFVLKGVINQFTSWGNNSFILYAIATLVYAIPYVFMMFEFISIKSLKRAESGYQTWLNAVIGKKYGFFGAFFYFFVNIFYFLDLMPAIMSYILYTVLHNSDAKHILDTNWFKPIIGVCGVMIFWLATLISVKGPKWMTRISAISGASGMIMTLIFIVGGFVALGIGSKSINGESASFALAAKFDISWAKLGAISWALQSLGGMEALAAYKNNIRGGTKNFRKAVWINIWIFTGIVLICAILAQSVIPETLANGSNYGLVGTIYLAFEVLHFPDFWSHVVAFLLLFTTFGGSLMLWTAAPAKILFTDAPKGILGKKLSKTDKEGTPINALIAQGIIVSVLILIFSFGSMQSGINQFLEDVRNIDGGAAGIPVLFILIAYIKLRIQKNKKEFDRTYYFLGKKPIWSILCVLPMAALFLVANLTALIPGPEEWQKGIAQSLIHLFVGAGGIIAAFIFCEYRWRVWRKENPNDNSLFNEKGDMEQFSFKKQLEKIEGKISKGEMKNNGNNKKTKS